MERSRYGRDERATSIAVETEAWEDFTTEMYFEGDNYLGVSARSVSLGYVAGKTARVDVQASVPYSVRWLDASGVPTGGEASQTGEVLENGSFSVAIGRDAGPERRSPTCRSRRSRTTARIGT